MLRSSLKSQFMKPVLLSGTSECDFRLFVQLRRYNAFDVLARTGDKDAHSFSSAVQGTPGIGCAAASWKRKSRVSGYQKEFGESLGTEGEERGGLL